MIMIKWKKFLNPSARRALLNSCIVCLLALFLSAEEGCQRQEASLSRESLPDILVSIGRDKYQTYLTCQAVGDTLWVYLPYTQGRKGFAAAKASEEEKDLYVEYSISSFNPFRTLEPPELKFLTQKILGEVRGMLLRSVDPFKYFVLVVTEIESSRPPAYEDWYIGYFDDVKNHKVGEDFSGEGYNRLVWHREPIETIEKENGEKELKSYRDSRGEHVNYHDMTLREFVIKQIKWRIYKRFTIEYNRTPFDITKEEKHAAVSDIVRTVFLVYNYSEFENVYLRDMSFLDEKSTYSGYPKEGLERYKAGLRMRKPAF